MISADAFFAFGVAFLIQLGVVIFSYGKLTQKVNDVCKKLDKMEKDMHVSPCLGLQSNDKSIALCSQRIEQMENRDS